MKVLIFFTFIISFTVFASSSVHDYRKFLHEMTSFDDCTHTEGSHKRSKYAPEACLKFQKEQFDAIFNGDFFKDFKKIRVETRKNKYLTYYRATFGKQDYFCEVLYTEILDLETNLVSSDFDLYCD